MLADVVEEGVHAVVLAVGHLGHDVVHEDRELVRGHLAADAQGRQVRHDGALELVLDHGLGPRGHRDTSIYKV